MKIKLLVISLLSLFFITSCSNRKSPTEPEETADLSISMLLKPASDEGYNVTRVHVRITRNAFADSMDLTINGESASSGKFYIYYL